jgi:hypothetical protein
MEQTMTFIPLTTQAAAVVQQSNTMHNLISMEKWAEAQQVLGSIEAQLQVLNRELWLQTHRSGEVR